MLMERGERPVIFDVALNERLLGAVGVDTSKVTMIRGDMADMPALISAIRDHDCDQIIHLAAFLGEEVQRRPYSGVRLNFMGTINVFEAARLENVKRVVFPSSGTVYLGSLGEGIKQIDENIPMNPPSVYAATKASCLGLLGRATRNATAFSSSAFATPAGSIDRHRRRSKRRARSRFNKWFAPQSKARRRRSIGLMVRRKFVRQGCAKGTVLAVCKDKFKDTLFDIGNADMR